MLFESISREPLGWVVGEFKAGGGWQKQIGGRFNKAEGLATGIWERRGFGFVTFGRKEVHTKF